MELLPVVYNTDKEEVNPLPFNHFQIVTIILYDYDYDHKVKNDYQQ